MLAQLRVLALPNNRLSGPLSEDLVLASATLEVLDLSGNVFDGVLPAAIAALPHLKILDLSWNSFSGFLPDVLQTHAQLRHLKDARQLRLAGNDFACPLPPWAPHGAVCTTRNCPLHHVSDGRACVPCRPAYFRDSLVRVSVCL